MNRSMNVLLPAIVALMMTVEARAHDPHHPEHNDWYMSLKRPDSPTQSCCGLADAYWCDEYYSRAGKAYCKITDNRDNKMLGRPPIPNGTEFEIPPNKLKYDRANPTGHAVIFVNSSGTVLCYVQGLLT